MKHCSSALVRKALSVFVTASLLIPSISLSASAATAFTDVQGHWAQAIIARWQDKGVVAGFGDGTFRPDDTLTVAQYATILNKVMLYTAEGSNQFTDVNQSDWFYDAITKLNTAGVTVDASGSISPNGPVDREEAAVMAAKMMYLDPESGATTFSDDSSISDWARPYVKALQDHGGVTGEGNNLFSPKATLTRAESLAFLDQNIAALVTASGTYSQNADGNLIVNTPGVVLDNITITGDLILAPGIGLGNITVNNAAVNGRILIAGGNVTLNGTYNNVTNYVKGLSLVLNGAINNLTSYYDLNVQGNAVISQNTGANGAVITIGGGSSASGSPSGAGTVQPGWVNPLTPGGGTNGYPTNAYIAPPQALPRAAYPAGSPVAQYGAIKVGSANGIRTLVDQSGNPVQLKGMSTFGLQWDEGDWILTDSAFQNLADFMGCQVVRLAMYVGEGGYATDPAVLLDRVETGIQLASKYGMYVIVDWHVLTPGDPTDPTYLNAGVNLPQVASIRASHPEYTGPQLFFAYLSAKYGTWYNVLFEDANEPNGLGSEADAASVWANKLLPYHQSVVNAIRAYDADQVNNIVICGTDNWSQFVDAPVGNPVQDRNNQIMYTVHFYAGTHDTGGSTWLEDKITNADNGGLAVFATEWGTSTADAGKGPYIDNSERWLSFLDQYNISWCNWSLAHKVEAPSATVPTTPNNAAWTAGDLTVSGAYVRAKILGLPVPMYPSQTMVVYNFENGNDGNYGLNSDNPNASLTVTPDMVDGNGVMKISNVSTNGVWDNRPNFSDMGVTFGLYSDLSFDVYLSGSALNAAAPSDPVFSVQPVFQYPPSYWNGNIPETDLSMADFTPTGTGLYKAAVTIPLSPLEAQPLDTLGHIVFLMSLSGASAGADIYLDNLAFSTPENNGDIKYQAAVTAPDNPGTFAGIPFTFEDNQREGWAKDGTSAVDYTRIVIGNAETKAMMFPVSFDTTNNAWEDGARLACAVNLPANITAQARSVSLDLYIEDGKMTTGSLGLVIGPIPNGGPYWDQLPGYDINEADGQKVISSDGTALLKYHINLSLDNGTILSDLSQYGMQKLLLALYSNFSDYVGNVYYDNISLNDQNGAPIHYQP